MCLMVNLMSHPAVSFRTPLAWWDDAEQRLGTRLTEKVPGLDGGISAKTRHVPPTNWQCTIPTCTPFSVDEIS